MFPGGFGNFNENTILYSPALPVCASSHPLHLLAQATASGAVAGPYLMLPRRCHRRRGHNREPSTDEKRTTTTNSYR